MAKTTTSSETQDSTGEQDTTDSENGGDNMTGWDTVVSFADTVQPVVVIGTFIAQLLIIVGLFA